MLRPRHSDPAMLADDLDEMDGSAAIADQPTTLSLKHAAAQLQEHDRSADAVPSFSVQNPTGQ